jgi:hypothetical protein
MAASKKKAAKKPARKAAPKAAKAPAKKTKPAKKAAAKPAKKKPAAKKSAAPKKKAAKSAAKAPAKKAGKKTADRVAKSAAKKQAPAAQSKKKAAAKAPEKAAKTLAAPKKAASATKKDAASPAKKATAVGKLARSGATGKKARPKKPILPMGPRHPKLGFKWICFSCTAKFYDLGREEPICPKCETNQLNRPPDDPKQTSDGPKSKLKVVRPMAQLLDDEEPAPAPGDEMAMDKKPSSPTEEMFDDTEGEAVGLDIDEEADPDGTAEPPEIDVV